MIEAMPKQKEPGYPVVPEDPQVILKFFSTSLLFVYYSTPINDWHLVIG